MPRFTHTDFRVGAIYRCCVRYLKSKSWAQREMRKLDLAYSDRTVEIWFRDRHMDQAREDYHQGNCRCSTCVPQTKL